MSRIDSRIKQFTARLTQWWNSRSGGLRQSATDGAQRAASRARDFRDSERGQRAAAKINDLRASETAKKAEAKINDLRQREPVKKAEESARKVMHDLFSSGSGGSGTTGGAS
jgi:hypothetical protein